MFWARAFQARLKLGAPQSEIDEAWRSYIAASEVWNTRIMVFIATTERFYGSDKSNELERDIQFALNDMANSLADLRYAKNNDFALQQAAHDKTEKGNQLLYKFVRGFEQQIR